MSGYLWSRLTPSHHKCGNEALKGKRGMGRATFPRSFSQRAQPRTWIFWVCLVLFLPWWPVPHNYQTEWWRWGQAWPEKQFCFFFFTRSAKMEMRLESKKWPPASESSKAIGANATEKRIPGGWKEAATGHQAGEWWKNQSKEQSRCWSQS